MFVVVFGKLVSCGNAYLSTRLKNNDIVLLDLSIINYVV